VKVYTSIRSRPGRQAQRNAGLRDLGALRDREGRRLQPKVFLLADQGFDAYSTFDRDRRELVEQKPDMVQRFVDASIVGLVQLHLCDNRAANALIKRHNPELPTSSWPIRSPR